MPKYLHLSTISVINTVGSVDGSVYSGEGGFLRLLSRFLPGGIPSSGKFLSKLCLIGYLMEFKSEEFPGCVNI